VYEKRTGDHVGAMHMLTLTPPGASVDISPTWMVAGATTHSKAEHQRNERVAAAAASKSKPYRRRNTDDDDRARGRVRGGRGGTTPGSTGNTRTGRRTWQGTRPRPQLTRTHASRTRGLEGEAETLREEPRVVTQAHA